MKLVIIAPSGGGKGSLAEQIRRDFGIPHISTGDMFRSYAREDTPLGREIAELINGGTFVPDATTMRMLMDRLSQPDVRGGFILDGVPRTLNQARLLDAHLKITLAVELDVDDDTVIQRLAGRYICTECATNHSVAFHDLSACRKCGGELSTRKDDKTEAIKKRLAQYHEQKTEIVSFYKDQGCYAYIPVSPDMRPPAVYEKFLEVLKWHGLK